MIGRRVRRRRRTCLTAALLVLCSTRLAAAICAGDCNRDGKVRIHELQRTANLVVGSGNATAMCAAADADGDTIVSQEDLLDAVSSFLSGPATCPTAVPTPAKEPCFQTSVYAVEEGGEPSALAAGDFNADSYADLIVVNTAANSLTQLNNDGSGHFAQFGPVRFIGADTFPSDVTTFRKNDDDFDDFAVVREPTEEEEQAGKCLGCATYWQSDMGAFIPRTVAVGIEPLFVRAGDLDADGDQDLIVVNASDDTLSFLPNQSAGGFSERQDIDTSPFVVAVTIGDFNEDGAADVASVGLDGAAVHLNTKATPQFFSCPACTKFDAGIVPTAILAADVNADDHIDLIVADNFLSTITIHPGNGDGSFGTPTTIESDKEPETLVVADLNHDGIIDIAATSPGNDAVLVFLGDGEGGFSAEEAFAAGSNPSTLAVADFDHDGRQDLATAAVFDDAAVVLLSRDCAAGATSAAPLPRRAR